MLNRIQAFRERGWQAIDAKAYGQAWARFGGSVATHPLVVEQLADLAQIPVRYLGWHQAGELKAAIPVWGRHLALSKDVLKRAGKKALFDAVFARRAVVTSERRMRWSPSRADGSASASAGR